MPRRLNLFGDDVGKSLDLSQRAIASEWMDEPCTYEEFRACLRDLSRLNELTLASRPTLSWLEQVIARRAASARLTWQQLSRKEPLRIVDVGFGYGDMLRKIEAWARKRGIAVKLTGVDLNPYAALAAREATGSSRAIEWVTGDAYSYKPAQAFDIVISSLFTHHLTHQEIVHYLSWMEETARLGWFINDVHRHRFPYYGVGLLAKVARFHRFVQHDGPVSVRRSFREADWQQMLREAGLSEPACRIETYRPGRLCVGHIKLEAPGKGERA